jgi:hypothetical protein
MRFIIAPQAEKPQKIEQTMCVLCSEDPRWCA